MLMDTWNPDQYSKFQREREQPFDDLIALIQRAPAMQVVDLGCGTGTLTRRLHAALNAHHTVGVDRSNRMLDVARREAPMPGLRFETGSIEEFDCHDEYDVICSNAAFHWVENHESLLRRLFTALKAGGQLAFQVPAMHDTLSHGLPDRLAALPRFRDAFGGWTRPQPVLTPEQYSRLLFRVGFEAPKVHLTIYPHVLASRAEVVEWLKGTLLTEYEKRLTSDEFVVFTDACREVLLSQLPDERPFFFPFKRIFCWGRKA
jgi:trans-aconitate 2-methyltransferase